MLSRIDIFGSEILLRFDGKQSYQTQLGSVVTILIVGFIFFRLVFIVLDVFQRLNPQVIYNERQVDDPAAFNATSYSFPIAFGMEDPVLQNYYIDEGIYTINATFRQKFLIYNETTQNHQTVWINTDLKLKPCTLDNFQNPSNRNYYTQLNYTNTYCLPPDFNIALQGDFPSPVFSYLQLTVYQCSQNCKSQDQITKFLNKANFGMQLSDTYVDPTIKDNPFKFYSRDMFWGTSPQLPKDVYIYLRNNYVQSDFGWFFSDIQTQKYPSYSYQEDTTYPPNSQKYILRVMIRFEKQKEGVYKRTYQNFNSIISEIGGFTQSLLAIGYLFCKKFSKLKLNLELINQSFNYDETSLENNQNDQEDKSVQKQQQFDQQQNLTNEQYQNAIKVNEERFKSLRKRNFLKQSSNENKLKNQNQQDQSSLSPTINKISISNNMQQHSPATTGQNVNNIKNDKQQFNQSNINKMGRDKSKTNNSNTLNSPDEQSIFSDDSKFCFKRTNTVTQRKKESQFKQMIEKKTNKINVSTWEYFKSLILPTQKYKKKKQIIKYSVDKLYHNLDIFNILKKLVDVEKLKRLLLDQDQLRLFDCLPKPTIQPDLALKKQSSQIWDQKNKEIDFMYQDERSEMQKLSDAFQSYVNITQKQNQGGLDKKIINLLDRNLLQIFQKEAEERLNMQTIRQNSESAKFNIYDQFLSQSNIKQPQKVFQIFQQQNQIKSDSILDANSCNQSDLSSIQDEFMKVEVQNKINQTSQVKDYFSNQEAIKNSQQIVNNNCLKQEKQNKPNQFETKNNQLNKI
ncbi:small GTP-binding domain protein (macronuclear) [Tetrahymena thermophila SB210]|uniref:Small GTP-binding domain protein n=1 Tax=Tetrahymena thermophila (strain SB210) TaxID=312017 RepID=I7LUH0_TETTS|nr:small GTP-binding domain protein [Tetrahymena thermophila SB210]EAR93758.2 small GTP-binding domain protein [Tetrahymena thermophila SB210]|eukprot:XP_001014003.2 small GTP-binding domain protein [Tetrahymena thermophila SB210]